ncbi:DUF1802 family protein [Waterburya agarophytonicola K14]|uniref:DUF1802 family protein n=1 Tax=Waterburya agarophytonicola KI4 TaxID=2874699 RepID=A0A964BVC8_9CYAN|nr:DUF1802 family protein [Waterburya agarophytonicola]MCC0179769.1 DUF1802 family protein [Waterburya agarophytonicola KI4]
MLLTKALKEWAIAVDALTTGKTVILLRKGGIKESKFQVKSDRFWLYPTYEHQKPNLFKSEYAQGVELVESGWHPKTVEIRSYAEISNILPIEDLNQIKALLPYHIWNEQMISDRLKWKPQQPLIVLLLRVYRLASPVIIPYHDNYGGCKSWIDLVEPISTEDSRVVIEDSRYTQTVREIQESTSN